MTRVDTQDWLKTRKKKHLCLRVAAKSHTAQLEVNRGRARLRRARERKREKKNRERSGLTKNDRAERMSQQLWGHHWHKMTGDCSAFGG